MKLLYFDCGMGAAGDMLGAALAELLPAAQRETFAAEINDAGIPGVKISLEPSVKCGITGTHLSVTVDGEEESCDHDHSGEHDHAHEHSHHHEHDGNHTHEHHAHDHHEHHTHRSLHDIHHIIADLKLPETVREDILAVYTLIAEAESKAHGKPVSEIHFHEVGTMDAIADIASVCLLLRKLAPDRIAASPIHVGSGRVKCAHGILPVPAPATAYILKGIPIYGGRIQGELCTPTGAALLKHFVASFGEMPAMRPESTGYGMGKKDFDAANCVRAILGDSFAEKTDSGSSAETADYGSDKRLFSAAEFSMHDTVCELCCNVDDMTGEDVAFAAETFLENGALDAFTIPCTMKKGRPGVLITVLCREADLEKMTELMLRHTSSLGVRITAKDRRILKRSESECRIPDDALAAAAAPKLPAEPNLRTKPDLQAEPNLQAEPRLQAPKTTGSSCTIRYKTSSGFGITRTKYEHDDLAKIARTYGLTLEQLRSLLADLQ